MTRITTSLLAAALVLGMGSAASAQTKLNPPGSATGDMNRSPSGTMNSTKGSTTGSTIPGSKTGDVNRSQTGRENSALGSGGATSTTSNGAAHKKLNTTR